MRYNGRHALKRVRGNRRLQRTVRGINRYLKRSSSPLRRFWRARKLRRWR